jgi:hypothetical protein
MEGGPHNRGKMGRARTTSALQVGITQKGARGEPLGAKAQALHIVYCERCKLSPINANTCFLFCFVLWLCIWDWPLQLMSLCRSALVDTAANQEPRYWLATRGAFIVPNRPVNISGWEQGTPRKLTRS